MKDNNAPTNPELSYDSLLPAHTPHTHRKIQTADRGHVRAAPVICLLITRLSTARLCEERNDKTERDSGKAFPEFCFSSSGRACKPEYTKAGAPILGQN